MKGYHAKTGQSVIRHHRAEPRFYTSHCAERTLGTARRCGERYCRLQGTAHGGINPLSKREEAHEVLIEVAIPPRSTAQFNFAFEVVKIKMLRNRLAKFDPDIIFRKLLQGPWVQQQQSERGCFIFPELFFES